MPPCGPSATTPPWPGRSSRSSGRSSSTPAGRRRARTSSTSPPASGNASIPAARAGARVVACDLSPALLDAGRRLADEAGVTVDWQQGDAEALPFADASFDVVMSSVGVMFAPHHEAAADELVRVAGRAPPSALASWTPEGFIGQMFAAMKPYAAPPPPGAQPPPLWGDEAHVRDLLGDRVEDFTAEKCSLPVAFRPSGGLPRLLQAHLRPDDRHLPRHRRRPDKVAALDTALADLARDHLDADGRWAGSTSSSPHGGRPDVTAALSIVAGTPYLIERAIRPRSAGPLGGPECSFDWGGGGLT